MLNARTVQGRHADVFTYLHGNLDAVATHCHMPCSAGPDSLVFVSDLAQLATARERGAAVLIVQRDVADQVAVVEPTFGCCFSVKNVSMGMALLLRHFDRKRERFNQWGERHPTAVVHESATLGANVLLGPYCVIGANAVIGDGCCIGSHVVVENDVRLVTTTLLHPHVFVGAGCELGRDCEVHPHTSIGSDGFGYAVGASRRPQKLSHLGNVCIGDEVEIGSNCAIDRATLSSTHIRSGTKIDNICHIAHNCDLAKTGSTRPAS
jgi:UDP-3-O-[3-hydroxymyristoyl] glucosamine N-acyltransferase